MAVQIMPGWSVTQDSTANTAQTLAKDANTENKHFITSIEVAIKGATAGADINIVLKAGATAIWKSVIGSGAARGTRINAVFNHPIEMAKNTAANLVIDAGGADVVTVASMTGYTRR